jgi:hypothetical protein
MSYPDLKNAQISQKCDEKFTIPIKNLISKKLLKVAQHFE